ncbi:MAG: sigma-70 family RNA polymerase sigma factor [Spirochaetes bacterium]|nr:sigma-70 family RNA polymerase sigma factor [Spirochaetota bacterium]
MFAKNRDFAETYSDLYPLVFSTIYSKVGSLDDAEDICQELFIKLYDKLDEVENRRKWLYGALKLEVMAYYRKRKAGTVDIDEIFDDAALAFVNGFRDTRIMISEAIEELDTISEPGDRVLFDLIAVRNFSYEEAGSQVGLSKRQVRYRYGLIVDRLVDYFKKKGINSLEELL